MRRQILALITMLLTICTACQAIQSPPASTTMTSTLGTRSEPPPPSETRPSGTRLSKQSPTLQPTVYASPTTLYTLQASTTPMWDPAKLITRTPAPPAICPALQDVTLPNLPYPAGTSEQVSELVLGILAYLNSGGDPQVLSNHLRRLNPRSGEHMAQHQDVTGDGLAELLVTTINSLMIFGCQDGTYQDWWPIGETYHGFPPEIVTIVDMNLDGVNEVIAIEGDARIRSVSVFEWDGSRFLFLNKDFGQMWPHPCADLYGESWADARDTNEDTLLELVLEQAIPISGEYIDGLPWRREKRTCAWNGASFVLSKTAWSAPEYRFQAVQDGDRAALNGEYKAALAFYEQAINDTQLEWWSAERAQYEREVYIQEAIQKPPPLPGINADPAEYPILAAYAEYRILLLHVAQNQLAEAQAIYENLRVTYVPGRAGYAYTEMAIAFWAAYKSSQNLEVACAKAIEVASAHPQAVLSYLGNNKYSVTYFGEQSLEYQVEDLCPFH